MADTNTYKNYELTTEALLPTNANDQYGTGLSEWGITSNSLTGCIVQDESLTVEPVTDQTQDQLGRVVSELDYDKHYTLTLQLIGAGDLNLSAGGIVAYQPKDYGAGAGGNAYWKVRSIQFQGAYNDKKKYTATLERWTNFPSGTPA